MKIFKYVIPFARSQFVTMPIGAQVLSTGAQNGDIVVWAKVNPDAQTTARHFLIYGTGWEFDNLDRYRYLGTVQIEGFVLHIFMENV